MLIIRTFMSCGRPASTAPLPAGVAVGSPVVAPVGVCAADAPEVAPVAGAPLEVETWLFSAEQDARSASEAKEISERDAARRRAIARALAQDATSVEETP